MRYLMDARPGLLLAALAVGGCVGGSPAGSLMGIAAGFDPTGISGMVAGQVMAAEAEAAAAEQQAQVDAMMAAYMQGMPAMAYPGMGQPGITATPGMAGATALPPVPAAAAAPSSAEQAAIAGLAASPVGTSITWTDPATGDHGRVTVRSIEQAMGGRSCRHITRTIERATGAVTAETSVCTGDAAG